MPYLFKNLLRVVLLLWLAVGIASPCYAQKPVEVGDELQEYFFNYNEVEYLEDAAGNLTLDSVAGSHTGGFRPVKEIYHVINNKSTYWYRIKVKFKTDATDSYVVEFFDQTLQDITAYIPDENGVYEAQQAGSRFVFGNRPVHHKNFQFGIHTRAGEEQQLYFRVKSNEGATLMIVLRSVNRFIHYALDEYFAFGIFYGMILIFSLYNLLMFIVLKQRQYLYYILYILCIGVYEMAADGIAFQYLWPDSPVMNKYTAGIALYFVSIFALLFTRDVLHVKSKAPNLNKLILAVIFARTVYLLVCLLVKPALFYYTFVEIFPLSVAFFTSIYLFQRGFRAARFFVLGYSILFVGVVIKVFLVLGYGKFLQVPLGYYSLTLCFILQMVLLSFAIGDKVRLLKRKKENAQRRIISQMNTNIKLKDNLNRELEEQVAMRTSEVVEKSEVLLQKARIIEQQNDELLSKNILLKQQADEISRMNALLQEDNVELQTNIHKVTQARVMSSEVDFEEFSQIYPDNDTCFKFLADVKWENGYTCWKCGHDHYFNGRNLYSRRCAKCSYDESVTANTIFQNARIPINKAFYMVFLIYTSQGKISSHKLSEILSIRQGTCWAYCSKVKKIMEERKKELQHAGEKGWSKLVMESNQLV